MNSKKRILVAPLNWGLGHATRCIPIIYSLIEYKFEVFLAGNGSSLALLEKEFPNLESIKLPSYNVTYTKHPLFFKWKILLNAPSFLKTIKAEKKAIKTIITDFKIDGIISDNRFGLYSKKIPCVIITHQLRVLSGSTTWFSTKTHQKLIKQFDECWVPDNKHTPNLSGKLGHFPITGIPTKYIGPLSRFTKKESIITHDLFVLLSGPEPQRSILEKKLLEELKHFTGKTLFVRGVVEEKQTKLIKESITIYNFMTSARLEKAFNESAIVLSRSGYTTILDLATLEKKAFFIPTPGQYEQIYLAKRLSVLGYVSSCRQKDFKIDKLKQVASSSGLKGFEHKVNYKDLFCLFQSKRKFTSNF